MHNKLWVLSIIAVVLTMATSRVADAAGDSDRGKREFLRCVSCHSAEPNVHKTGPSLAEIWGQKAGAVDGFSRYSEPLKQSQVVWDRETLDTWLRDPQSLIPGNKMTLRGLEDARSRQDIIAYLEFLASQHAQPSSSEDGTSGSSDRPKTATDLPDLSVLAPQYQVTSIRYYADTYFVTKAIGETTPFWEFNLRFKTDSTDQGPPSGIGVILGSGMQGDRYSVIFSSVADLQRLVSETCETR